MPRVATLDWLLFCFSRTRSLMVIRSLKNELLVFGTLANSRRDLHCSLFLATTPDLKGWLFGETWRVVLVL